jgi:predicted AlkP superfamily phosphohydrolase/phosphomutase
MNSPRTLIIGLDGATFDLIEPWSQAGYLPNLTRLMQEGAHGPLPAWPNMNSAAAWTSIVTGFNPGEHGIYDFGDAPSQRGQRWRPVTGADRRRDPFWRLLSAAGQRVGIINVPVSYPADPINGFMLSGMDAPGLQSPRFCHPATLLDDLRQAGIDYVLDVPNLALARQREPHQMPPVVKQMVQARSQTMLYMTQKQACDVVMAVFVATDRMQHQFWVDEPVTDGNPGWRPLRQLYQLLDECIGEALQQVDSATTVLVISDHGFGPARRAGRCVNPLLARLRLLRNHQRKSSLRGSVLRGLMQYGRRYIPQRLQVGLALALPRLRLQAQSNMRYETIDWSGTQAFVDHISGRAFINLHGRQPEGRVAPEEYEAVRERLRAILLGLIDPATGRPIVRQVQPRENLFHGPRFESAADLTIEWDEDALGHGLSYSNGGETITMPAPPDDRGPWKGSHRSKGIFIAWGPNIKRGVVVSDATHYDVAPTILHLHGQAVPGDMEGKVLTGIIADEHLRRHPVVRGESPVRAAGQTVQTGLDEAEAELVEQRLRDLGYIE